MKKVYTILFALAMTSSLYAKDECPADAICQYDTNGQIVDIRGDGSEGEMYALPPMPTNLSNTTNKKLRVNPSLKRDTCPADAVCKYDTNGKIISIIGDGSEGKVHKLPARVNKRAKRAKRKHRARKKRSLEQVKARMISKLEKKMVCVSDATTKKEARRCMRARRFKK